MKISLQKEIDLTDVLDFATLKHLGQTRDNGEPYITHPIKVAKVVDEYKGKFSQNRNILIASALLHDTLEDTYTSYRELEENFGKEVASIVEELTTAPYVPKMIGKNKYLAQKMQMMTRYALFIKLADRYCNLCDLDNTTKEKRTRTINDTIYIINYLKESIEFTIAQKKMVDLIESQINLLQSENTEEDKTL